MEKRSQYVLNKEEDFKLKSSVYQDTGRTCQAFLSVIINWNQEEEKRKEGLCIFCGNILNYSIQADTAFTDSQTQGRYWVSESETVISVF